MTTELEVEFWGTRGSLPSPGVTTARYGGNTSCVEMRAGGHTLIFDAGTGIRALGRKLLTQGRRDIHLFMSHYHWDHIMGFPFFGPLFVPDTKLHLYGETKEGFSTAAALGFQMRSPFFPLSADQLAASLLDHPLLPGDVVELGEVKIRTCRLNHPQDSLCYRVEVGEKSAVYATDIEHGSALDGQFVDFVAGADLLIMDCTFTDAEYPMHQGWGHATWESGVRFANAAGVGRLAIFHHLPERLDRELDAIAAEADALRAGTFVASEGLVVSL